jgi:hypothetical protein
MKMLMNMRDEKKEDEEKYNKIKCSWFIIRYNSLIKYYSYLFNNKNKWLRLKKIKEVFGRPIIILVHHIILGLKIDRKDIRGKQKFFKGPK